MQAFEEDLSKIASLVGDKVRAAILVALMEGKALTAGELALSANASAQTTSNHLKKLINAELVQCEPTGRHRYYRLASSRVATAVEAIGILAGSPKKRRPPRHGALDKEICFARSCYDHLAGALAIQIKTYMLERNILSQKENTFVVSEKGKLFFAQKMGIDTDALKIQRRLFAKPCLDWTERECHGAGSLGTAILEYFISNRLVIRSKSKHRVLNLTEKGKRWIVKNLS